MLDSIVSLCPSYLTVLLISNVGCRWWSIDFSIEAMLKTIRDNEVQITRISSKNLELITKRFVEYTYISFDFTTGFILFHKFCDGGRELTTSLLLCSLMLLWNPMSFDGDADFVLTYIEIYIYKSFGRFFVDEQNIYNNCCLSKEIERD